MLLLILFFQLGVPQSSFYKLVHEFLKTNIQVNKNQAELQLASLNHHRVAKTRPWRLSFSSSFKDNELDSASRFGNRQAESWANTLSFQKDFIWGGGLVLENHFTRIHNDPSSASVVFGGPQRTNEFGQSLTFKQALGANFLGRDQYSELKMAWNDLVKKRIDTKNSIEVELFRFYEAYLSSSLNKALLRLQKEALKRAERRVRLVKKRVRDGLRQSVDLLQANIDETRQREEFKNAKINLHDTMEDLSHFLHREVKEHELEEEITEHPFWESVEKEMKEFDKSMKDNPRTSLLKEMLHAQKTKLQRMEYRLLPQLELVSRFSSNRYAEDFSSSFSRGLLGQSKKEWLVGLQLNIPLGFELEKASVNKERIHSRLIEMELQKTKDDVKTSNTSLILRFEELKKNMAFAKKRNGLAKKILREYNNLYRLGEKDLDRVIHAEETLIQTEQSLVTYRVNKNKLLARFAYLHGNLRKAMTQRDP